MENSNQKCPQILKVHGEAISFGGVVKAIEEVTGNVVQVTKKGTLEELRTYIDTTRQKVTSLMVVLELTYV